MENPKKSENPSEEEEEEIERIVKQLEYRGNPPPGYVGHEASGSSEKKEPKILRGVVFEKFLHPDGKPGFKSSARDRKVVFLESGAVLPDWSKAYDVEVVSDSNPGDPNKGKLTVRLKGVEAVVPMKETPQGLPKPIEVDESSQQVYVFETILPLVISKEKRKLVPNPEKFKHFTLDQRTMATIEKIATAVDLREPCLLEGETATSKTSAIEYLAMVTGNEVARLNLNGQTDTSELIGKYVPNDGQLQISFEQALKNPEILTAETRGILEKAKKETRGLTLVESQKIAKAEGMKIGDWRWQDGIDIQAKKEGHWLIFDEINLAEAQILERLNSQLEKSPSITVTEHGNEVVRELNDEEMADYQAGKLPGVVPLHENFRIFATMNPAEYSGRKPMSPAYKDRWLSYKFVEPLTAEDHKAMMNLLVYGEQPIIEGPSKKKFGGEKVEPLLKKLGKIPWFREFIPKMAKFQADIEKMARDREIGKDLKEKYIFTRRGLLGFLEQIQSNTTVDRRTGEIKNILTAPKEVILKAIQYYYLDKMKNNEDLFKARNILDAIGIGIGKWTLGSEGAPKEVGRGQEKGPGVFGAGDVAKVKAGPHIGKTVIIQRVSDRNFDRSPREYTVQFPGGGGFLRIASNELESPEVVEAKPEFKVGDLVKVVSKGSWYAGKSAIIKVVQNTNPDGSLREYTVEIPGITGLHEFAPNELERLKAEAEPKFKVGDSVRFKSGPYLGKIGVIHRVQARDSDGSPSEYAVVIPGRPGGESLVVPSDLESLEAEAEPKFKVGQTVRSSITLRLGVVKSFSILTDGRRMYDIDWPDGKTLYVEESDLEA